MSKNHSVYVLISLRWEVVVKHLNQPAGRRHLSIRSNHLVRNSAHGTNSLQNHSVLFFKVQLCTMNEVDPLYSSYIVNCALNAFSAYTAIMLNILSIHAMRKTSSLPKPLKTLLLSLAVSDLGVGLLAQPLFIARMVNPTYSTRTALSIITLLFGSASFFTVVAISVDRFLAIQLHLRYQELVTQKRVVTVVILIWVLCVSFSFIFIVSSKEIVYIVILTIEGFCFIITTVIYCRMFFTVKHHRNQIQVQQVQVVHNVQYNESAARQRKSAVSTFYVFLVFLVCYLPEYCVLVQLISPPRTDLTGMLLYSHTLMFLNSSLNPVIYCWKMKHIRHAMTDVLRNIFPRQDQANL